jgi:hypothetical protein
MREWAFIPRETERDALAGAAGRLLEKQAGDSANGRLDYSSLKQLQMESQSYSNWRSNELIVSSVMNKGIDDQRNNVHSRTTVKLSKN